MRPRTHTFSPAAADRNGVCAAQQVAAARELLINGALSSGYDRNGICQAQTPAAAGAMTLNGAYAGTVLDPARRLLIYSDGNDSGVNFVVTGTRVNGEKIVESITGPNATYVFSSGVFKTVTSVAISAAGTGNIEVGTQGVSTMDLPRHASIYCAADMSGVTFTITGTDRYGTEVSEDITGPDTTTVTGSINFDTITKVYADGAVGTNTEVGSADEFETKIIPLDRHKTDHIFQIILSSDKNYTVDGQVTADDLVAKYDSGQEAAIDFVEESRLQSMTADLLDRIEGPVSGVRCQVTSFVAGSFELTTYSR